MATIPPKKKSTKGLPPPVSQPSANLTKEAPGDTPLNFKVSTEFHREFKTYAAQHDISMLELLQRCFNFYKENTK